MIPRPEEVTVLERGCTRCNPKLVAKSERVSDRHVSVLLDDRGKLYHNGELVDRCIEAEHGAGGWALLEIWQPGDWGSWGLSGVPNYGFCDCTTTDPERVTVPAGVPRVLVASDGFTFEPTADDSTDPQ